MIKVRVYQPGDRDQLERLASALYATQHESASGSAGSGFKEYFDNLLSIGSKEGAVILVAEHENELVGFVCLLGIVVPEGQGATDSSYSFLSDLFVREDFRYKGVGGLLNKNAEHHARQAGANRIALKVLAENRDAVAFYRKQNYDESFRVLSKSLE